MSLSLQEWEKSVFDLEDIHVIAVGNGMYKKIVAENPQLSTKQIISIPNGSPMVSEIQSGNLSMFFKKKYNKKILLCVGSIQPRKNQIQFF